MDSWCLDIIIEGPETFFHILEPRFEGFAVASLRHHKRKSLVAEAQDSNAKGLLA